MYSMIAFYKENATILRKCFEEMGFKVNGAVCAWWWWWQWRWWWRWWWWRW